MVLNLWRVTVMTEWKECKLGDIVLSANTGLDAIKRAPIVDYDTGIKCLRIQDISQFKKYENWGFTEIDEKNFSKFQLKENDIIVARTGGSIGVNTIIKKNLNAVLNNGLIRIRANNSICDSKYLFFNFRTTNYGSFIESISDGTSTQPNMQINVLLSYDIMLPPLSEQKAIANILSSLDNKIDLLHCQNKTLEQMAETLFRQWFIEEAGENWEEIVITDLFEVRDGTHDSPKQTAIGKPLITSKHILTGRLDVEKAYLISEIDFEKVNQRSKVETGDILFSMIGTIGLLYLEQSLTIDYAIKNIGLFKTSQNCDWRIYTYLWLKSSIGQQYIDEHKSGSTQEYVSLSSLRSITFRKPPEEKLCEFNKFASKNFSKIYINQKKIQTLEKLRDNLLPKLMSGEVRVALPQC